MSQLQSVMALCDGIRRTHIWFKILEGDNSGIKISIARYDSDYSESFQNQIESLEEGEVYLLDLEYYGSSEWELLDFKRRYQ